MTRFEDWLFGRIFWIVQNFEILSKLWSLDLESFVPPSSFARTPLSDTRVRPHSNGQEFAYVSAAAGVTASTAVPLCRNKSGY